VTAAVVQNIPVGHCVSIVSLQVSAGAIQLCPDTQVETVRQGRPYLIWPRYACPRNRQPADINWRFSE